MSKRWGARPRKAAAVFLVATAVAGFASHSRPHARGQTVQGDALRSEGRFLRGMAWYEVGAAQSQALAADALHAWNQAVRADYEQYLADRARRAAVKKGLRDKTEAEAAKRLDATRRRWRENPTVEDVRSGIALNALACDLADPRFVPERWRAFPVELPPTVTIQALAFRVTGASGVARPSGPSPSAVALGRMKGEKWPVSLRRPELGRGRDAYRGAVAAVVKTCAAGKPLRAPQVDAVRDALSSLKREADSAVPTAGGLRKQADTHLARLDEATRIFYDRDFAEELVRDAEKHKAGTVGELLGFMKKYRLVFAEGDDDPEVWSTYQTLYNLLKRQKAAFDFADDAGAEGKLSPR